MKYLDFIRDVIEKVNRGELSEADSMHLIKDAVQEHEKERHPEEQYLDLIRDILKNGVERHDRTGVGTLAVFNRTLRFDLSKGFPLLTTKRVPLSLIASELIWFIAGDTNIRYLLQYNNHIWDEWPFKRFIQSEEYDGVDLTNFWLRPELKEVAAEEMKKFTQRILDDEEFAKKWGDLGNVYGKQWRRWENKDGQVFDQLSEVINLIKNDPHSRRMLVSAWNVGEIKNAALPPCHDRFQFFVADNKLSCWFVMRSNDVFLGLPFNIASYALLTHMIAYVCGLDVGELIYTGGDVHIYKNHLEQVKLQITREPRPFPTLKFNIPEGIEIKSIFDFKPEYIKVENYNPHPTIKGDVAV